VQGFGVRVAHVLHASLDAAVSRRCLLVLTTSWTTAVRLLQRGEHTGTEGGEGSGCALHELGREVEHLELLFGLDGGAVEVHHLVLVEAPEVPP